MTPHSRPATPCSPDSPLPTTASRLRSSDSRLTTHYSLPGKDRFPAPDSHDSQVAHSRVPSIRARIPRPKNFWRGRCPRTPNPRRIFTLESGLPTPPLSTHNSHVTTLLSPLLTTEPAGSPFLRVSAPGGREGNPLLERVLFAFPTGRPLPASQLWPQRSQGPHFYQFACAMGDLVPGVAGGCHRQEHEGLIPTRVTSWVPTWSPGGRGPFQVLNFPNRTAHPTVLLVSTLFLCTVGSSLQSTISRMPCTTYNDRPSPLLGRGGGGLSCPEGGPRLGSFNGRDLTRRRGPRRRLTRRFAGPKGGASSATGLDENFDKCWAGGGPRSEAERGTNHWDGRPNLSGS